MRRRSAFSRALQEAQHPTTVEQQNGETVEPSLSNTATPLDRETVKPGLIKTSFYLRLGQSEKLDDLAYGYKKRTGKRIDRQDIVRALIDSSELETLLNLLS